MQARFGDGLIATDIARIADADAYDTTADRGRGQACRASERDATPRVGIPFSCWYGGTDREMNLPSFHSDLCRGRLFRFIVL